MNSADDVPEREGDRSLVTGFAVQPDVGALYDRYGDAMHASARKVLAAHSMESDAGDAVGVVVKRLVEAHTRGEVDHKDNWEPYLRRACRNEALRIAKKRLETGSLEELDDSNASSRHFLDRTQGLDPVAEQVMQWDAEREAGAAIAQAQLTDRQAYVVFCYFDKHMTDEQISAELGISRSAVSKARRAAQDKIERALQGGDSG
jgi:RNA polymerase sigma factor (sigma-70 family)